MEYFRLGANGPKLSRVILGGHEYLPDGRSRGFNEDFDRAIQPGVVMDGFGGPERLAVLEAALDLGITCFDVTIDSEKEALGRNLRELAPSFDVFFQTRPEGMVYAYDPANRKMRDLKRLRDEVIRIIKLMGRERIDILNFGILQDAIDADATFLDGLAENIAALKSEGLIGYAAADTFSGPATYRAMIASGAFDSININYNVAEDWPRDSAIPAAKAAGMAVAAREALIKGELFNAAGELAGADTTHLARGAIKWVAATPGVDAVILGAASTAHLMSNVEAVLDPTPSDDERASLEKATRQAAFADLKRKKNAVTQDGQA